MTERDRQRFPGWLRALALLFCAAVFFSACGCPGAGHADSSADDAVSITFGYWDVDSVQNAAQSDRITRTLEEKFGFQASVQSFNWSNYKSQYQILAATGELPDVFTNVLLSSSDAGDTALFNQMVEKGELMPLPDDLSAYPHLAALLSDYEYLRHDDGHMYAIPHPLFAEELLSSSDAAMLVRRDWMESLGLDDPQSFDEFLALAAAFSSDDPDGNGKDDTFGYNVNSLAALGKWVILGIAPECNVYSWVEGGDGSFAPCWMTEEFREVVSAYRRLYETGALDPNFFSKNPAAVVDDFVSGRLGLLEYKSSASALAELKEFWEEKNELPFAECVDVLPVFPSSDGVRYSSSSNTFWSETYISASVTEEQLDIILSLMDYLLSDEGYLLYTCGIEGEDYRIGGDGEPVSLIADEGSSHLMRLTEKYPSVELWSNLANRGWDSSDFENTPQTRFLYGEDCVTLAKKALDFCRFQTVQVSRPYDFLTFPKEHASYSSEAFSAFIECILGEEDPLAMWDEAVGGLKKNGLEGYVKRQNELYRERSDSAKQPDI